MKILAIDIGAGTQDILFFNSERKIENSISLVLPTPSQYLAKRLNVLEGDVYIRGDTIGGGSLSGAIRRHLQKGYCVVMEEAAAYSIRNDLDEVRSLGIEVGPLPESLPFKELVIGEIDLPVLKRFLAHFGEDLNPDVIAVAVQDHGVAPRGLPDRVYRFEKMEAMLRKDNRPETFHYVEDNIPDFYLRMRSVVKAIRRVSNAPVLVMDTALSAIVGCLEEADNPSVIVNVGNGHTIAALLIDRRIEGLYEHHTHELTPGRLESDLRRFLRGELTGREVFEANGHGVITLKAVDANIPVVVTGPNRDIFRETSLTFRYAAPGGNTMMSGPVGLIRAAQFRFGRASVSGEFRGG